MSHPGLSFLYQTRTILSTPAKSTHRGSHRLFSSSACRCEAARLPSRRIRTLSRDVQADVEPGYNPNSTLTPVEDRKFRAIFEAAAKGLLPPSLQNPSDNSATSEEVDFSTRVTLDSLFENLGQEPEPPAKKSQPQPREQPTALPPLRELPPDLPQALQGAWRDVRRAMAADFMQDSSGVDERDVSQHRISPRAISSVEVEKRNLDIVDVQTKFKKAKSDAEIWSVIENELFPRVSKLVQVIRERVASSTKKQKRKVTTVSQNAVHTAAKQARKDAVAALIQSTYPIHLVNALRALRTKFPQSPYSLALIPAVKKLDPVSQVLGLSTELYNELLYIMWRQHSDIFECARIIEDMNAQGLIGDNHTSAVFLDAEREMRLSTNEDNDLSLVRRAWWQLGAVRDAMRQWHEAMDLLDARAEEERLYQKQWQCAQNAAEAAEDSVISQSANGDRNNPRHQMLYDNEIIAQPASAAG